MRGFRTLPARGTRLFRLVGERRWSTRRQRRALLLRLAMNAMAWGERVPPLGWRTVRWIERWALRRHLPVYFDAEHYARINTDARAYKHGVVRHWLDHGAREGRDPHPLFDTRHYRAQFAQYPGAVNPLLHFLLVGRRQRVSPTRWFSYEVYLSANTDVMPEKIEPYEHFVRFGVYENRRSTDLFDPGLPADGEGSALLRFLRGEEAGTLAPLEITESRGPITLAPASDATDDAMHAPPRPRAMRPADQAIAALLERSPRDTANAVVDVVIPAYRNRALTLECIGAVLRAQCETPHEIVVIDDESPDSQLSADLAQLAERGLITLLRNARNRGFVVSANRGMALHGDRDVVLLNSDAVVYNDWLDRMRAAALREPRTGTVTPLTNRGTICSYPIFCRDNPVPLDLPPAALDRIAARVNAEQTVALPTGVGFCMYVRRALLDEVGLFDEEAFGAGYGEENDLCLRGQARGWCDVAATDVFVRHYGSMSFGSDRFAYMGEGGREIAHRYPGYGNAVRRFIEADPLRPHRARIDRGRLVARRGERNMLVISHRRGGGTEQNVHERTARLRAEGWSVFRLVADPSDDRRVRIVHSELPDLHNVGSVPLEGAGLDTLADALRRLRITHAEVHSLADLWRGAPVAIADLLGRVGASWRFVVHDYAAICPRIHLVNEYGTYCGEPEPEGCNACLARRGSDFRERRIMAWRGRYGTLLGGAECVEVPDKQVAGRFRHHFPRANVVVAPHERVEPAPLRHPEGDGPVTIGTIGAISPIKGLPVLHRCARTAQRRGSPLRFTVIGYTGNDAASIRSGLRVTGPYTNDTVLETLEREGIDAIFLASTVPETFSYTLSIALRAGRPIVAFDIGAVASRLRALGPEERRRYLLLPLAVVDDPVAINRRILRWLGRDPGPARRGWREELGRAARPRERL